MSNTDWLTLGGILVALAGPAVGAYVHLRVKLAECQRDISNLHSVKDDMGKIVMRLLDLEKGEK